MGLYHFHNGSVKKAEVSLGIKELNLSLEERNKEAKGGWRERRRGGEKKYAAFT